MPEITLDLLSMDATPLATGRSCRFEGLGGTIGRDEGNTLVLQDKHRRVSRLHASVTFPDGVATLTNTSTTLPVSIGTKLLKCGSKAAISAADLIEIGPYILKVRAAEPDAASDAANLHSQPTILATPADPLLLAKIGAAVRQTASMQAPLVVTPAKESEDPFADLFADPDPVTPKKEDKPAQSATPEFLQAPAATTHLPMEADPFADLLGLGEPSSPGRALPPDMDAGVDPFKPYSPRIEPSMSVDSNLNAFPERSPMSIIPEDFNPFELPSQTARNSADPLAQMLGIGPSQTAANIVTNEPSIDALFSSGSDSALGNLTNSGSSADLYRATSLDSLALPSESSDPMMMFGVSSDAGGSVRPPVRDDLPEVGGAYQPPRAIFSNASMTMAQNHGSMGGNASPGTGSAASPDALTEGFLKGTGLPASALPGGLTPEMMTVIGSLLRTATAGAIDMLAARAATKLEVQASVTIISAQSNNPLKFLPNAETALQQMLGKKMPGFMRPDEAMRDAFDDLRAHEIGVIAGTRAALTEVLGRFDPALLEKRLAEQSFLESLLPSIRKTKLWEIYLAQYSKIRREAEDDFQSIFGRSFLDAYERETARVKAHTTDSGKK
ncbi:MAG: type VI secretion system-associated FHA domain protein TagH [Rhodoferax sp.]